MYLQCEYVSTNTITVSEWEGEVLDMARISRLDMGAYLCIASNGVPPTVSKRVKVSVDCKYQTKKTHSSTTARPTRAGHSAYANLLTQHTRHNTASMEELEIQLEEKL